MDMEEIHNIVNPTPAQGPKNLGLVEGLRMLARAAILGALQRHDCDNCPKSGGECEIEEAVRKLKALKEQQDRQNEEDED